jgi:subtilase family serine protease
LIVTAIIIALIAVASAVILRMRRRTR